MRVIVLNISLLVNYFLLIIVFRNSMTNRKAFKLNLTHRPKNATLVTRRQSDAYEKLNRNTETIKYI